MKRYGLFGVLSIIILSSIFLCSCGKVSNKESLENNKKLVVTYSKVNLKTINDSIASNGTIYPNEEVLITNKIDGRVVNIYVDLGDYVKKGQLLAKIDPSDYKIRYDESLARVESLKSSLEGIGNSDKLIEEHSIIRQNKANMDEAYSRMKRLENLVNQKLVSQQDYDTAKAKYNSSKAAYDNSLSSVNKLVNDLNVVKANSALSAKSLQETNLVAPISGYIQKRDISLGEYLRVDSPTFVLVQINPLKIKATVPEKYALAVKKGLDVSFTVDSLTNEEFKGVISRVAPAVDVKTRTLGIEVTVNNSENKLKPGLFAKLNIDLNVSHEALLVPASAVYSIAGLNKVFTIKNAKVSEKIIDTGVIIDDQVEVFGDIKPGENIVITDVDKLSDGLEVEVVENKVK